MRVIVCALVVFACSLMGCESGSGSTNDTNGTNSSIDTWRYHCAAGMEIGELGYNLTGMTLLVTGANGWQGFQISLAAARAGAHVLASCRTDEEAEATRKKLEAELQGAGSVETLTMDLSSFASVSAAAAKVLANHGSLDVLLHEAGTSRRDNLTADGFPGTLQINHLSPALMTELLLPSLMAAPAARVVYLGSGNAFDVPHWPKSVATNTFVRWSRGEEPLPAYIDYYSLSKFLNVHYAKEQALRMPSISIFSVNPGFVRDPPSAYPCPPEIHFRPCPQAPSQGATSTLFAAAQPGIEEFSGAMFDFKTDVLGPYNFSESGDTCIPRPLPTWDVKLRSQWYDHVQLVLKRATLITFQV